MYVHIIRYIYYVCLHFALCRFFFRLRVQCAR